MNKLNSIHHRVRVQLNAERTEDEVLAELNYLKSRVDLTHNLVAHLNKKLEGFIRDYGHSGSSKGTEEKKLKKIPEEVVSVVMRQYGTQLLRDFPETSILGNVVAKCGEAEHDMAQFQANYETRMEQNVLSPLQTMLEDDYEAIQKNMLDLKNLAMKVDMAKSRYKDSGDKLHKFLKSGLVDAERERSLREKLGKDEDEVEIATQNLEQFKDSVATNLLAFVDKESVMSEKLIDLLIIQRDYHYSCYRQIDELLPILRDRMTDYAHKSVYGTPLEEHLRVTGREVAVVIEECASVMTEIGLEEEGLLRIPGSNSRIKRIIAAFNYPGDVDWDYFASDIHSIGGALKQYFRDLPECLLTAKMFDAWLDVAQKLQSQISEGAELDLSLVTNLLFQLPKCNFINLRYLIKFLAEMGKCSEYSKMTPTNLAIVMGGNLLWAEGQEGFVLRHTPLKNLLVEVLIAQCDVFFPDFKLNTKRLLKQEDDAYPGCSGLASAASLAPSSSVNSLNSIGSVDRETSPAIAHQLISHFPDGSSSSSSSSSAAVAFTPGHRRDGSGDYLKPTDGLRATPTPRKSVKQRPAPTPGDQRPTATTLPRPRSGTPPEVARPSPAPQVNRPPAGPAPVIRPTPAPRDLTRPVTGPPSFPPPELPSAKGLSASREASPALIDVVPAPALNGSDEVDAAAITLNVFDATDGPPPPPPSSSTPFGVQLRGTKPPGEKPPISRNKPSLSDDKERTATSSSSNSMMMTTTTDNQYVNNEAARPPRPQSKPPIPVPGATINGSGRPPPRPLGGPPPPPQPPSQPPPPNRLSEGDDVFTHL